MTYANEKTHKWLSEIHDKSEHYYGKQKRIVNYYEIRDMFNFIKEVMSL